MCWLVLGLSCVVAILVVWFYRLLRDVELLRLRVEDLEIGRPVKIEDGPSRLRGLRQDR